MKAQEKAQLLSLLRQKKALLDRMLLITRQIKAELQQDNIEAFAEAISSRQQIIAQIDMMTKSEQSMGPGDDDIEVLSAKKEIRAIVAQTLREDEENTAMAQQKLNRYRDQIRQLNQTKKGVGGYTKPMNNEETYFVDANK